MTIHASLTRGNVTIVDESTRGLPAATLQAFTDVTAALSRTYPPPNTRTVKVTIRPTIVDDDEYVDQADDNWIAGSTDIRKGKITINARIFTVKRYGNFPMFMSMVDQVPPWLYVLAHEYGHVFTPLKDDLDKLVAIQNGVRPYLSWYGQTTSSDGYAEAFAEWTLSGGNTMNVGARRVAARYQWPVPGELLMRLVRRVRAGRDA
jgi:hypothetical protein